MPSRRTALAFAAALGLAGAVPGGSFAAGSDDLEWALWRGLHLDVGGRVIDDANGKISHSEGQGYGLILAVAFDDISNFVRIWSWTKTNLLIRDDGLMAWRWQEDATPNVQDVNNATDGDILVAWALSMAAGKWTRPDLATAAQSLATAIVEHATVELGGRLLLLPGVDGFVKDEGAIVNPSYWIFPALTALGALDGDPRWQRLYDDGLAMLEAARVPGRTIADWVLARADGSFGPPPGELGYRTGYNAYRVPLYLLWAGEAQRPVLDGFADLWAGSAAGPIVMEASAADGLVVSTSGDPGYSDLPRLLRCVDGRDGPYSPTRIDATGSYYAATMALLTRLVARERYPQCLG
jgi:endo-1,4-beta-D-glucanase Y